jgi:hypothetical protein
MVDDFVNIKYQDDYSYASLQIFNDHSTIRKVKFKVQDKKSQQHEKRDGGRIELKARRNIPFKKGNNASLKTTAGTFQMKPFPGWASQHVSFQPIDCSLPGRQQQYHRQAQGIICHRLKIVKVPELGENILLFGCRAANIPCDYTR